MAEQLGELGPRKILDIGSGSGNGLLALLNRFKPTTVISLEENVDCIDTTVETLVNAGNCPLAHLRLSYELDQGDKYRVFCSDAPVELEPGISIVQTDITRPDTMLVEALENEAPFDAITVWLIGTDAHNLHSVGTTPADYRWHTQRRLCELADRLLRPGGWIQFVDRTAFPLSEDQQRDLVEDHKALLDSSRLEFLKFSNRSYQEAGEGGIPMAKASGKIARDAAMGLKSLISRLPDDSAPEAGGAFAQGGSQ
jgi:SAM-dependent methyltransferase